MGGGGTGPDIVAKALALSGGKNASVAVRPQSSADADAGEGQRLWDVDGKKYLDFFGGIVTVGLGHCEPRDRHLRTVGSHPLWTDQRRAFLALFPNVNLEIER